MSKLVIIRGLPGSGKTALARNEANTGTMFIEPDALLMEDEEYKYTPFRYAKAKAKSLEMVTLCGIMGCDVVYADVLPTVEEVDEVISAYCIAWVTPVILKVIDMPMLTVKQSCRRNVHNVRREDIEKMAAKWEDYNKKGDRKL